MYKRYYDGYSTNRLHNPDNNSSDSSKDNTATGDIIEINDTNNEAVSTEITNNNTKAISGFSPISFGGLQTDDLILLGLLLLLLFDSDNVDTTLLIIIGVIFIAGLNL